MAGWVAGVGTERVAMQVRRKEEFFVAGGEDLGPLDQSGADGELDPPLLGALDVLLRNTRRGHDLLDQRTDLPLHARVLSTERGRHHLGVTDPDVRIEDRRAAVLALHLAHEVDDDQAAQRTLGSLVPVPRACLQSRLTLQRLDGGRPHDLQRGALCRRGKQHPQQPIRRTQQLGIRRDEG